MLVLHKNSGDHYKFTNKINVCTKVPGNPSNTFRHETFQLHTKNKIDTG